MPLKRQTTANGKWQLASDCESGPSVCRSGRSRQRTCCALHQDPNRAGVHLAVVAGQFGKYNEGGDVRHSDPLALTPTAHHLSTAARL
jgi:hypothetical protein